MRRRDPGWVCRSAQVCALSVIAAVFAGILIVGLGPLENIMREGLSFGGELDPMSLATQALAAAGWVVLPLLVLALLAGLLSNVAQVGWRFAPARGVFGGSRFGVFNVLALAGMFAWTMWSHFESLFGSVSDAGDVVVIFLVRSIVALGALSAIDYALARRRFETAMELDPAEAARELREREGDPTVRKLHRRLVTTFSRESHAGQDTGVAQASREVRS